MRKFINVKTKEVVELVPGEHLFKIPYIKETIDGEGEILCIKQDAWFDMNGNEFIEKYWIDFKEAA